jgi:hypothetical protein
MSKLCSCVVFGSGATQSVSSKVPVKREPCVRHDKKESEIKRADFPAEAPESNSNQRETYNTQQSMYDLSGNSAKELAFAEKHESDDRPNNQRASDEQYHGNCLRLVFSSFGYFTHLIGVFGTGSGDLGLAPEERSYQT